MKLAEIPAAARRWLEPEPAIDALPDRRDVIAGRADEARQHLRAGRAAADQGLAAPAAALYGIAIARLSNASAPDGDASRASAATSFSALSWASTPAGKDALALLEGPGAASALGAKRLREALGVLERAGHELSSRLYPASDREVSRSKIRRRLAAGLGLFLAVGAVARWTTAPRNVALGKPVTASSVRFGFPGALVNGAIEWGSFGLHTGGSGHEWARIDLEKSYALSSAEIYPRGEGRFEFDLPLSVELSDDGSSFRPAGACKDLFTQATPCAVDLHGQRARFVRVAAREVVLAEVEVYARP